MLLVKDIIPLLNKPEKSIKEYTNLFIDYLMAKENPYYAWKHYGNSFTIDNRMVVATSGTYTMETASIISLRT